MSKPTLKKDFWEELDKLLTPTQPPSDSFTVRDFMKRRGFTSISTGCRLLRPLVEAGKLVCNEFVVKGHRQKYYSLPK